MAARCPVSGCWPSCNFSKQAESVVAICSQRLYLLVQLKKQDLGICALDSVFNAIVLNKILYALPVYFGYSTEGHKGMLRRVLKTANRMGFTYYGYDLYPFNETSQYKLFRRSWSERHCLHHLLTVKPGPPGAMILFSQTSDLNLINAILLLVQFLIMSNISCACFMRISMYFMILLSVLVLYVHSFVNMSACHVYFLINLSYLLSQ